MKNAGLTIGMLAIGLGLASIGFNLNGNQANATPAAFAPSAGPVEPTIVWYDVMPQQATASLTHLITRAWSDGKIEQRGVCVTFGCNGGEYNVYEVSPWTVISSPNEGLNAAADINFDSRVDAADLGLLVAAWGDAPRNDYPPSDCPLGLIP